MSKETATTNTIINSQALKSIMRLEGKTTADIAAALNITRKHAEKKSQAAPGGMRTRPAELPTCYI